MRKMTSFFIDSRPQSWRALHSNARLRFCHLLFRSIRMHVKNQVFSERMCCYFSKLFHAWRLLNCEVHKETRARCGHIVPVCIHLRGAEF